jgi:hypothetical protein
MPWIRQCHYQWLLLAVAPALAGVAINKSDRQVLSATLMSTVCFWLLERPLTFTGRFMDHDVAMVEKAAGA